MNGERNRVAVLGLVFTVAVLGLLAGNRKIREQLSEKSKQLLGK